MAVFLNVIDKAKLIIVIVEIDIKIEGLLFRRVVERVLGHDDVGAETVYFLFDGLLKTAHNEEGSHSGGQPNGYSSNGYRVNGR